MSWPIKLVSLADAHARRAPVVAELDRLGLAHELFEAVDGRDGIEARWNPDIDRKGAIRMLGRSMTDREYGCALSHMSIYREVLDRDLPGVVVLEDDAVVGELFVHFMEERLYERRDFIQLDYGWAHVWRFGLGRSRLSTRIECERLVCNSGRTTGYSVSRRAARFLLDRGLPLRLPADWPCDLRPLRPVVCVPRVVSHPPDAGADSYLHRERSEAKARGHSRGWAESRWSPRSPKPGWYPLLRPFLTRTFPPEP